MHSYFYSKPDRKRSVERVYEHFSTLKLTVHFFEQLQRDTLFNTEQGICAHHFIIVLLFKYGVGNRAYKQYVNVFLFQNVRNVDFQNFEILQAFHTNYKTYLDDKCKVPLINNL